MLERIIIDLGLTLDWPTYQLILSTENDDKNPVAESPTTKPEPDLEKVESEYMWTKQQKEIFFYRFSLILYIWYSNSRESVPIFPLFCNSI